MMHYSQYRPDTVIVTGVIEPWDLSRHDPVAEARRVAMAFSNAVIPPKPGINLMPHKHTASAGISAKLLPLPTSTRRSVVAPQARQARQTRQVQQVQQPQRLIAPRGPSITPLDRSPRDVFKQGVVNETVMRGPMAKFYVVDQKQQGADATGNIWQQIKADRGMVSVYGAKIPGPHI